MIIALDFETANMSLASVCAVGLAWLDESTGEVTRRAGSLVHPPKGADWFSPGCVRIHGIHARDVAGAPEWPEVWARIRTHLSGTTVLAHNAVFDISVLRSICQTYSCALPESRYLCTCKIARKVWPELINHRLNTVCDAFGWHFPHHHAQADAEACARIYSRAIDITGCRSPDAMAKHLALDIKQI